MRLHNFTLTYPHPRIPQIPHPRPALLSMTPDHEVSRYLGLFTFTAKVASIVEPLIYSLVVQQTNNPRLGFATTIPVSQVFDTKPTTHATLHHLTIRGPTTTTPNAHHPVTLFPATSFPTTVPPFSTNAPSPPARPVPPPSCPPGPTPCRFPPSGVSSL